MIARNERAFLTALKPEPHSYAKAYTILSEMMDDMEINDPRRILATQILNDVRRCIILSGSR